MKDIINTCIFIAIIIGFFVLAIVFPADYNVVKRENRNLAEFPEISAEAILTGAFARGFEDYLSDNIGYRAALIDVANSITALNGITPGGEAKIVAVDYSQFQQGAMAETTERPITVEPANDYKPVSDEDIASENPAAPAHTPRPEIDLGEVIQQPEPGIATDEAVQQPEPEINTAEATRQPEPADLNQEEPQATGNGAETSEEAADEPEPNRIGKLLVFHDRLVQLFDYREQTAQAYADALNGYRLALGDNVKIYSMLVPTAIEFMSEKYKSMSGSQQEAISVVNARLSDVTPVDVYTAIEEHTDEYVYFRTDHHWTALGAYYAYLAFCDTVGVEPVKIDNYKRNEKQFFLGYLYNMSPSETLKKSPDTVYYYELKVPLTLSRSLIYPKSEGYQIFIGGDQPLYEAKTSVGNGRTVCIVKDSYANAFVPWIAPHYENIVVIDPRTFDQSAIQKISEYECVDLIFLNYVMTTSFADFVARISAIK